MGWAWPSHAGLHWHDLPSTYPALLTAGGKAPVWLGASHSTNFEQLCVNFVTCSEHSPGGGSSVTGGDTQEATLSQGCSSSASCTPQPSACPWGRCVLKGAVLSLPWACTCSWGLGMCGLESCFGVFYSNCISDLSPPAAAAPPRAIFFSSSYLSLLTSKKLGFSPAPLCGGK